MMTQRGLEVGGHLVGKDNKGAQGPKAREVLDLTMIPLKDHI